MYDYLIVGSGLYGAIFAREGKKVLVIDKRPKVGGNIYTEKIEGINVHKYRAHIFHTNNKKVRNYVNKYATFNRFSNSPVAKLGTVLLPRASYYIENNQKDEFLIIAKKAIHFVWIIAIPLMLYFILFAKEGIFFLSGSSFGNSIMPMQVIMQTLLFTGISNIMGIQMMIPLGNEKVVLHSEIVGAFVDLIINIALIPKLGATGAAIGTVVAELFVCIVQYFALKDMVFDMYKNLPYKSVLLASVIGVIGSLWIKSIGVGSFITLAISSVLFFGIYFIVLTFMKEKLVLELEKQVLDKVLNRGMKHE